MTIQQKIYLQIFGLLIGISTSFAQFSAKPHQFIFPNDIENTNLTAYKKEFGTPDRRGLVFGINMGMLKGNSNSALYFSGAANNENNIKYIIEIHITKMR